MGYTVTSITILEMDDLLDRRVTRDKPRAVYVPITDTTAEWIAASCTEHGARLLRVDSHFADVDMPLPAGLSDG